MFFLCERRVQSVDSRDHYTRFTNDTGLFNPLSMNDQDKPLYTLPIYIFSTSTISSFLFLQKPR